jgi:hypothetical protein
MYDNIPKNKAGRQQKMTGFENNCSWSCIEVKIIYDGCDVEKLG